MKIMIEELQLLIKVISIKIYYIEVIKLKVY
jgi:hypothetical protein